MCTFRLIFRKWKDHRKAKMKFSYTLFASVSTEDGLQCPSCYREFRGPRRKEIFKIHFSTIHLQIKKFECSHCSRRFAQSGARKRHEITCGRRPAQWKSRFQLQIVGWTGVTQHALPSACPSCWGSDRSDQSELFQAALGDV